MSGCKTVVFVNYNGGSPLHGPNLRTFYHAKSLSNDYKVSLISSSYSHKYKNPPVFNGPLKDETIEGVNFSWLKVPKYNSIFQRIICQYIFGFKLLIYGKKLVPKNSIIVFSCPPQDLIFFVYILAKIRNCKLISDVRDIWPLTQIQMSKLNYLNPYTYILYISQFFIYRFSEKVISPLKDMWKQFPSMLKDKFVFIPNTSSPSSLENNSINYNVLYAPNNFGGSEMDVDLFMKKTSIFKVVYSGSFDRDNAFEYLVYASENISRSDMFFVFVGDGIRKDWLIKRAKSSQNIVIFDKLAPNCVVPFLKNFDLGFCALKSKKIYHYGVSLGKSFEYLRAGIPLIWMVNSPPVLNQGCIKVEADDLISLVNTLEKINVDSIRNKEDIIIKEFNDTYSLDAIGMKLKSFLKGLN